jgi:hypothetical protein
MSGVAVLAQFEFSSSMPSATMIQKDLGMEIIAADADAFGPFVTLIPAGAELCGP